jgi:hypothetical protein
MQEIQNGSEIRAHTGIRVFLTTNVDDCIRTRMGAPPGRGRGRTVSKPIEKFVSSLQRLSIEPHKLGAERVERAFCLPDQTISQKIGHDLMAENVSLHSIPILFNILISFGRVENPGRLLFITPCAREAAAFDGLEEAIKVFGSSEFCPSQSGKGGAISFELVNKSIHFTFDLLAPSRRRKALQKVFAGVWIEDRLE